MPEPQFKPGDRVVVAHGRGKVWRIVRNDQAAHWESEPSYLLEDGQRFRYASESALEPAPAEATS